LDFTAMRALMRRFAKLMRLIMHLQSGIVMGAFGA